MPAHGDDAHGWEARTAFTTRYYSCHRCARTGTQRRTTDPGPDRQRFALPGGVLLLPRCDRCMRTEDPDDELRAERDLNHALHHCTSQPVVPLNAYRCSVTSCSTIWHELVVRPPGVPVFGPHDQIAHHPCPWCLVERPEVAGRDHAALARARGGGR